MKQGKRPTKAQKLRIKDMGLNYDNWLVVKDTPVLFEIVHRISGKTRSKRKEKIS